METAERGGRLNKRKILLDLHDASPAAPEFAEVDMDDFKWVDKKPKKSMSKKTPEEVLQD
jgi:hypothetical protein